MAKQKFKVYCNYYINAKDQREAEQLVYEENDFLDKHVSITPTKIKEEVYY
ncbi:unnamed protein product [marine sediment metagenome]|uniref:Uncharacterized protein n=1 Tax=marine sediment metagenome TaxID=412755 RepID=X1C3L5_9ZZZZ